MYYPPPIFLDQHDKVVPAYQDYLIAQQMKPEYAIPSVETISPSEWELLAMINAYCPTSGPMPGILWPDYVYASPSQSTYAYHGGYHNQYQQQHHHTQHPASPSSRSDDISRSSQYASPRQQPPHTHSLRHWHEASMRSPMIPRANMETNYTTKSASYESSSPRSIHTSHILETTIYPGKETSLSTSESPILSTRPKTEYEPSTTAFYTAGRPAAQLQQTGVTTLQHAPHAFKPMAWQNRRPPRRLTTREKANFQCEVKGCGKLFKHKHNYKAHMLTHDGKRQYPFPCPIDGCNRKFIRKTDLQRHNQSVHIKERNYRCDYCSRLFARKDTLRR